MKNSRNIDDLHPYVAYLCRALIQKCLENGIKLIVTSTYRDQDYQSLLYKQGRIKPGKVVTNAKLIGAHGYKIAFDVCPLVDGKCAGDNDALFDKIVKSLGLEWGGNWKSISDKSHFQYAQGLTSTQLRAGRMPKFPSIPQHDTTIKDATPKPSTKIIMKGEVIVPILNLSPTPNANQGTKWKVGKGTILNIYKEQNGWYLVNTGIVQWAKKDFIKIKEEK